MASRPKPQRLTRAQLQSFLGNDQQLIRAFEAYIKALAELTPDELNELRSLTIDAQTAATQLRTSMAALRRQLADAQTQLDAQRSLRAELAQLRRRVSDLETIVLGA